MGVFPQIGRVWITIDNKLFLWNYEEGSDFLSYESSSSIIVSVALVRPKRGNLKINTEFAVLSSPLRIIIFFMCLFRGFHSVYRAFGRACNTVGDCYFGIDEDKSSEQGKVEIFWTQNSGDTFESVHGVCRNPVYRRNRDRQDICMRKRRPHIRDAIPGTDSGMPINPVFETMYIVLYMRPVLGVNFWCISLKMAGAMLHRGLVSDVHHLNRTIVPNQI